MHFGMKRLNKRQIKKLTSDNYIRYEKRHYNMYKAGFYEFCAISSMFHKGKDKHKILQKAENALKYGLKMSQLNFDEFIKRYLSENNLLYKHPYLEGSNIEEAFEDLAHEAGYICDRYCEYRFYKFFYLMELCRFYLNQDTYSPILFEKEESVLSNAINIFNEQVENVGGVSQFSIYYNNHIREIIELNGENYNVYDDEYFSTPFRAVAHVRYVLNHIKAIIKDENKLSNFHLYQLTHALRQAERVLIKNMLPQDACFV